MLSKYHVNDVKKGRAKTLYAFSGFYCVMIFSSFFFYIKSPQTELFDIKREFVHTA